MVAVVFAVMLPAFVGFAALSVDTAVVAVARTQMTTAADAAALAGAIGRPLGWTGVRRWFEGPSAPGQGQRRRAAGRPPEPSSQ